MKFDAIIFDFDGVLVDSEFVGNSHIADYLTGIGHPTTAEHSMTHFMGLAGSQFTDAIEAWIGRPLPDDYREARAAEDARAMAAGIDAVPGAVAFVRALPADLPIAIASSSSTAWITRHLIHIGLIDRFEGRIFSGREHVANGKPAPDIYLHAAAALGVPIDRAVILEDSPVGVTGALASGATVIGLTAGSHCLAGHGERLRAMGVGLIAENYQDVARLIA